MSVQKEKSQQEIPKKEELQKTDNIPYIIGKLNTQQQKKFELLMKNHEDIFVKNKNELGKTNVVKHKIDTGNAKPIRQRPYRAIGDKKELIKKEIEKMLG